MELQHVNVKIYVDGELKLDLEKVINVFHEWIQNESVDGLLIDVADYRHVPAGPGVLLIGFEGDYSIDHTDNRYGLRYNRKAELEGSNQDRFADALGSALRVCARLESEFKQGDSVRFSRDELELFVNDRALAPNTKTTFESCKPELEAFFHKAFGHSDFTLTHRDDPRGRFGIHAKLGRPYDIDRVLEALGR